MSNEVGGLVVYDPQIVHPYMYPHTRFPSFICAAASFIRGKQEREGEKKKEKKNLSHNQHRQVPIQLNATRSPDGVGQTTPYVC